MFPLLKLDVPKLRFDPLDSSQVDVDKLKGLQRFGPYKSAIDPRLAFVFPKGSSSQANILFRALRSGVGYFKGMPTTFRMPLANDDVLPVSKFEIRDSFTDQDREKAYTDAVGEALSDSAKDANLFVILHPRTPKWKEDGPYYGCKDLLLSKGIVSQSVTFDLLDNSDQFSWSAANIALAIHCKLGGTPWVAATGLGLSHVVIAVGRSETVDPISRNRKRFVAFSTVLTNHGQFCFSNIGTGVYDESNYLESLTTVVRSALAEGLNRNGSVQFVAVHMSKDFNYAEMEAVRRGVVNSESRPIRPVFLKVGDEERFFLVDKETDSGVPKRGTKIVLSEAESIIYTEGRDDLKAWKNRQPSIIRVKRYGDLSAAEDVSAANDAERDILALSQVNFRGFNSASRPAPLVYSELISRIVSRGVAIPAGELQNRMWFL